MVSGSRKSTSKSLHNDEVRNQDDPQSWIPDDDES